MDRKRKKHHSFLALSLHVAFPSLFLLILFCKHLSKSGILKGPLCQWGNPPPYGVHYLKYI